MLRCVEGGQSLEMFPVRLGMLSICGAKRGPVPSWLAGLMANILAHPGKKNEIKTKIKANTCSIEVCLSCFTCSYVRVKQETHTLKATFYLNRITQ